MANPTLSDVPASARFPREELEREFERLQAALRQTVATGDPAHWVERYTEDVTYVEHVAGTISGREALRGFASGGAQFPGPLFDSFPVDWMVVDEARGNVVWRALNRLKDPGDGSVFEFSSLSFATYAGDGLWSYQEDAYSRNDVDAALMRWVERFHSLHSDH